MYLDCMYVATKVISTKVMLKNSLEIADTADQSQAKGISNKLRFHFSIKKINNLNFGALFIGRVAGQSRLTGIIITNWKIGSTYI